jgi:ATP synthase F1 delta subunit
MEELARVYSDELSAFASALEGNREMAVFFFSPYFSSREKKEGLGKLLLGADELLVNFLKVLIDNHRMPVISRIQRQFEELWQEENRLLPVEVTSAIELDDEVARQIQERVERQTGRRVSLTRHVDTSIIGGLVVRVSNMILDASIRNQLERLRRQVARAA